MFRLHAISIASNSELRGRRFGPLGTWALVQKLRHGQVLCPPLLKGFPCLLPSSAWRRSGPDSQIASSKLCSPTYVHMYMVFCAADPALLRPATWSADHRDPRLAMVASVESWPSITWGNL